MGGVLASFERWGASPENLFGVDLLSDRIQAARERFPGLAFEEAKAEALPFAHHAFDLVVFFTVFTSILDPIMPLNVSREVNRVPRPGGAVIWHDFRVNNPLLVKSPAAALP